MSINYPNSIPGVWDAHRPAIESVLRRDGKLNPIGPNKPNKHWWPEYLMPDGLGPGSANHGVCEASVFSGASDYWYEEMRPWWLRYLAGGLIRHCGKEARSGIYMQAIWMGVGTQLVNATRRGDQEMIDACRKWLDAMFAMCALSAFPVKLSGQWKVTGLKGQTWSGTGYVAEDERWTVTARGQRSWSMKNGKPVAGIPNCGANLGIYRAATGTGRLGKGEPFVKLLASSEPDRPVRKILDRVVNHPEDVDNLRKAMDLAPGMHDGCEFIRFTKGALCVTSNKINGNTAPLMAYAVDSRGRVECLVVHPPTRPARGSGKARWDAETRTVEASGGIGKKASLWFPVARYGDVIYHVKFPPKGKRPVLVYPEIENPTVPPVPSPPEPPGEEDPCEGKGGLSKLWCEIREWFREVF